MNLFRCKKFLIFFTFFVFIGSAFALSFNYIDPTEPYDSDVRLRAYSNVDNHEERWSFGYLGSVDKTELPDIYIQIIGPSNVIYQQYGHVGIVLDFKSIGRITFDYGVFNSQDKGFIGNFIHGNLYYYLWYHRANQDDIIKYEGRSNKYYLLSCTDEQKKDIVEFLLYNAKEENKYYKYSFFKDNCSTRVRDILDKVYEGKLSEKYKSIPCGTYRKSIERAIRPYHYIEVLYNILQGSGQDKEISLYDALFLPEYLEYALIDSQIATLAQENDYKAQFKKSVEPFEDLNPNYILYIFITIAIYLINSSLGILGKKNPIFYSAMAICSFVIEAIFFLLSILSIYVSLFTIHDFMWFNYNLIFINPFMLVSAIYSLRYAIYPSVKSAKIYTDLHKILSSFVIIALVGKLFYVQKNLYLILFFILYYHSILQSFHHLNIDNISRFNSLKDRIKKLWIK